MAVIANKVDTVLRLKLITGDDGSGNPVYAFRSYNNIKPAAINEDLYAVAVALAGLTGLPLNGVFRNDTELLYNV
ncbi:DUF1659 domain-containing protein [Carboxydothermus ferrireducens]|uniref:DUF1659 domain-containing protein n=1 Tax=Carboxydothermus ferrireducens DSM 11255 TaxID=1119529 RepID=A0ABX2R8D5_9THEO|nr:DUF1659 domain-containing protein [Carboxydothermus ferrireducens]NYE57438.1 hypothetical protein [Carboxydothermus ferrireducens DSM 11255]